MHRFEKALEWHKESVGDPSQLLPHERKQHDSVTYAIKLAAKLEQLGKSNDHKMLRTILDAVKREIE